jgi:hypothetical protein
MRRAQSVGLLALVATLGPGCGKAKVGDSCTQPQCNDDHTAFFCDTGVYTQVLCPGPAGCDLTTDGDQALILCDLTGTVPGDPCTISLTGMTLCEDRPNALVCDGTTFNATTCPTNCVTSLPDNTGGQCD